MNAGLVAAAYASAFRGYLLRGDEATLRGAYEVGRDAVQRELGVLELAVMHHDALRRALAVAELDAVDHVVEAAGAFFQEALSAFEMVQRGYRELQEATMAERRQAAALRRLSSFLADASLAMSTAETFQEATRLVAEHARELLDARVCVARVTVGGTRLEASAWAEGDAAWAPLPDWPDRPHLRVVSGGPDAEPDHRSEPDPWAGWLTAKLTALDGRELGSIDVYGPRGDEFSEVDEAILVHLAQMTSAAVERARLYEPGPG